MSNIIHKDQAAKTIREASVYFEDEYMTVLQKSDDDSLMVVDKSSQLFFEWTPYQAPEDTSVIYFWMLEERERFYDMTLGADNSQRMS